MFPVVGSIYSAMMATGIVLSTFVNPSWLGIGTEDMTVLLEFPRYLPKKLLKPILNVFGPKVPFDVSVTFDVHIPLASAHGVDIVCVKLPGRPENGMDGFSGKENVWIPMVDGAPFDGITKDHPFVGA